VLLLPSVEEVTTLIPMSDHLAGSAQRVLHWDHVYEDSGTNAVSWYQSEPAVSLELIELLDVGPDSGIIDIGGGASVLSDHLLTRGYTDLTVLDLSEVALEAARGRVGAGSTVTWLAQDVLTWEPTRTFALWHDRAVFHFLSGHEVEDYLNVLCQVIPSGGAVIMATFAPDGPDRCSGLPVTRYSSTELGEVLGTSFAMEAQRREVHVTPSGAVQPFTWIAARRTTA
jgi:trans-aconitate methyltransferase